MKKEEWLLYISDRNSALRQNSHFISCVSAKAYIIFQELGKLARPVPKVESCLL